MDLPGFLPNDVLRLIFEETVNQDKRKAVKYALICKLVRSWVEVVLYQDVHLYRERTIRRFLRTLESSDKPHSYFSTHVKSLSIVYDKKTINYNIKILSICNGVQNLTIWAVPNQFQTTQTLDYSYHSAVNTHFLDHSHLFMPSHSSQHTTEADFILPSFHLSPPSRTSNSTSTPTSPSTHSNSSTSSSSSFSFPIINPNPNINNELYNYYQTLQNHTRPTQLSISIQHPLYILLPNGPTNSPRSLMKASPHFGFELFENVKYLSIVNNWNDWVGWSWSWIEPKSGFEGLKLLRLRQWRGDDDDDGDQYGDDDEDENMDGDSKMNPEDDDGTRIRRKWKDRNLSRDDTMETDADSNSNSTIRFLPKVTHLSLDLQVGKTFISTSIFNTNGSSITPSLTTTTTSSYPTSTLTPTNSTTSNNSNSNSNSTSATSTRQIRHRKMIESTSQTISSILTSPELENLEVLLCILSFDDEPLETAFEIRERVEICLWNWNQDRNYHHYRSGSESGNQNFRNQNQTRSQNWDRRNCDFYSTNSNSNPHPWNTHPSHVYDSYSTQPPGPEPEPEPEPESGSGLFNDFGFNAHTSNATGTRYGYGSNPITGVGEHYHNHYNSNHAHNSNHNSPTSYTSTLSHNNTSPYTHTYNYDLPNTNTTSAPTSSSTSTSTSTSTSNSTSTSTSTSTSIANTLIQKLVFAHDTEPFKNREAGSSKVERMWKNAEDIVKFRMIYGSSSSSMFFGNELGNGFKRSESKSKSKSKLGSRLREIGEPYIIQL